MDTDIESIELGQKGVFNKWCMKTTIYSYVKQKQK